MQLTHIPSDPSESTTDLGIKSATKEQDGGFPWTMWTIVIRQYTPGGRILRNITDGTVTDVAGDQAVISDENGGVVTAGEIDDVTHIRTTYRISLVETPTPMPDFLN